jgi:hypothetical protein
VKGGAERAAAGRAGEVEVERKVLRELAFKPPAELAPCVAFVRRRRSADAGHRGGKPRVLAERLRRRARQRERDRRQSEVVGQLNLVKPVRP